MGNFEDTNLGKMLTKLKYFYKAHTMQVRVQVIIIFLLTTILCGQAGQSLSLLTSGLEKASWNPLLLLYYAWIKLFLFTLILNVILNTVILYIRINMDTTLYDKDRNFEISKKGTMGTGGFMQTADKTKSLIMDDIEKIDGAILGRDPDTNLVCSPKPTLYINNHKVVCGGSGSRKTTTQVLNELFQAIKRGESFVVTDPKGEIYEMLSVLAEEEGYTTKVMNLVNLENSDGIDFVKTCRDKDGKQDKEIRAVQTLAKVIMANTAENITGGFWDDNQKGLLTAAILYVMYDQTGRTEPTLAGAYEFLLHNDKTEIDKLFTNLDKSHPARAEYLIYAKTEAKVRDSVLNGLMMRLQILQTESAKRIVSSDEIDLTLPSKKKCAYFLIMSDQESTFDFIASLFFSMFFIKDVQYVDSLKKQVRESSDLIPVNLVMDEFPSIGTIPDFDKKLATVRSRKINITIIFQNYGQLIDKYEKNQWETIVANCDTNIYLGGNDSEKTAAYYSNRMGDMTVITKGKRIQEKLLSVTDNKFHPSYMTSESESSRPVMTKDELLRLDKNHAIVMMGSCRPLDVLKFVYTEHPLAKRIVERNQTIHIPNWRREMEGYPDLTDNELEPTVEMLTDTGKMREYLELHSNNRTYCLMDYLYEEFPDEYERLKALLEGKEGTPFSVQEEELKQAFTENGESASKEEQPEKGRPAPATPAARTVTSATASNNQDGSSSGMSSVGVKTVNLSGIGKSRGYNEETTKEDVKPEINLQQFMTGNYSTENSSQEPEQKTNDRVKSFGSRAETGNQRVKSFGAAKKAGTTESRFKKTTKDKFNEEEQQNKKDLERLQEQDMSTTQEEPHVSTKDNQDNPNICNPDDGKKEAVPSTDLSSANEMPARDHIRESEEQDAEQKEYLDSFRVWKDIEELEIMSDQTEESIDFPSVADVHITEKESYDVEDKEVDKKEFVSDKPEQSVEADTKSPKKETSEPNNLDSTQNEEEVFGDFEDFNPELNQVVLPEATGEEPEDDIEHDIVTDTVADMLPEDAFQDSKTLEEILPEDMMLENAGSEKEANPEEPQMPEGNHKTESYTEGAEEKERQQNPESESKEGMESENPDNAKIEIPKQEKKTESEYQTEENPSLTSFIPAAPAATPDMVETPAAVATTGNDANTVKEEDAVPNHTEEDAEILQELDLDIPMGKELNQDDFSLFSDTEESSAVVSGEKGASTKRAADNKKKGIRKLNRDKMNF